MHKKKLILITSVFIPTLVIGAILLFISSRSNDDTSNNDSSLSEQPKNEPQDITVEDFEDYPVERVNEDKPEGVADISREESFNYTDSIINPYNVATKPDDYAGKNITTRGWIVELKKDTFIIVSINTGEYNGIPLYNSSDINFSDYSENTENAKPVYLEGILTAQQDSTLAFKVSSIRL